MHVAAFDRGSRAVGTTSHFYSRHANSLKKSFRLDITSSITYVPYVYMDWCNFRAKDFSRTCFQGDISEEEWSSGPITDVNTCPFIIIDDIIPSRFALAYNRFLNVAFISLDPEQINKTIECCQFNDVGDDILDDNGDTMKEFFNLKL